jgi:hypothetical protein
LSTVSRWIIARQTTVRMIAECENVAILLWNDELLVL